MSHPFLNTSLHRIAQSHPAFLRNLDLSKLRANVELERAKQHLGDTRQATSAEP